MVDAVLKMLKEQRRELIKMNASKKSLDDIERKIRRERDRLYAEMEVEEAKMQAERRTIEAGE